MPHDVYVESKWVCNGVSFAPGDKVKIVRMEQSPAPNGMGDGVAWQNSWSEGYKNDNLGINVRGLSEYIGFTYEINNIDETGAYFVEDEDHNNPYGYPLTALEKIG
jgi:hypothetical protein